MNTYLKAIMAGAAMFGTVLSAGTALAGRHPQPDERAALERVLTQEGFTSWGEIEMDDGLWEVEDARTKSPADGKFDLKIDPTTLKIVTRHRDD
ncbi:PepSY domain-containing protein [Brucella sp. 2716]|uniref:PepSY domain-containing protein n=1 Tax=Brucella sp. 2716 TaxID=2975052 RepID=UPI00217CE1BD|nr:PepSY domain-containing protein [Brucella sp. 2716]UWF59969.1 PepSY domain-containing protein [Brucella sp. 2716]